MGKFEKFSNEELKVMTSVFDNVNFSSIEDDKEKCDIFDTLKMDLGYESKRRVDPIIPPKDDIAAIFSSIYIISDYDISTGKNGGKYIIKFNMHEKYEKCMKENLDYVRKKVTRDVKTFKYKPEHIHIRLSSTRKYDYICTLEY